MKILVVDDDSTILASVPLLFKTAGYEVATAATGEECLQAAIARERQSA